MVQEQPQVQEPTPPPAKVIAGCFASCAFSVSVITGVAVGNEPAVVLSRAILCLFGAFLAGLLAGEILSFVIRTHLLEYFTSNPVPDSDVSLDDLVSALRVDNSPDLIPNTKAGTQNPE